MNMILRPQELRFANLRRVSEFGHGGVHDWTPAQWGTATCGEIGELLNAIKKSWRKDGTLQMVMREAADVAIYADLWCASVDVPSDLWMSQPFDDKCHEVTDPERMLSRVPYLFHEGSILLSQSICRPDMQFSHVSFRSLIRELAGVAFCNRVPLASAIVMSFNTKSEEIDSSVRLTGEFS